MLMDFVFLADAPKTGLQDMVSAIGVIVSMLIAVTSLILSLRRNARKEAKEEQEKSHKNHKELETRVTALEQFRSQDEIIHGSDVTRVDKLEADLQKINNNCLAHQTLNQAADIESLKNSVRTLYTRADQNAKDLQTYKDQANDKFITEAAYRRDLAFWEANIETLKQVGRDQNDLIKSIIEKREA